MPKRCQAPGSPGIEPGTSAFSLPKVVAQLGIEPMTTRFLVVVLTTKLLGHAPGFFGRGGRGGGPGTCNCGTVTRRQAAHSDVRQAEVVMVMIIVLLTSNGRKVCGVILGILFCAIFYTGLLLADFEPRRRRPDRARPWWMNERNWS